MEPPYFSITRRPSIRPGSVGVGGGRGLADVKMVLGYFQADLNMSDVLVIITGVSGTSCAGCTGCTVFVLSLQSDACGRSVL